ncbi:MAG: DUF3501 family protein [Pseudomonadota bacterium]|nr:DUF3501 family protein [Pseudomonadota bacterium]
MKSKSRLDAGQFLDLNTYEKVRAEKRAEITDIKRRRRLAVGPYASVFFESYDTIWYQIQEMLRVEKGGKEQLEQEIEAYNDLVPNGSELVITLMFEIPDAKMRAKILAVLGGVEETVTLLIGNEKIYAVAEDDVERSNSSGKASSVHFLHFPLTSEQAVLFRNFGENIFVGVEHPNYGHIAAVPDVMRKELSMDLSPA